MDAFALALFSAVSWGIAPIFGKLGLRDAGPVEGMAARTVVTMALVFGCLRASGRLAYIMQLSRKTWTLLAAEAVLATVAGDFAYYAALKYGSAGQAATVLAASPLVTMWCAATFLKEKFTTCGIIGAMLVVLGLVLIGVAGIR